MAETMTKGTLFNPETVKDLFSKVSGRSSIAKLSSSIPVAFNGNEIFTFSMDDEANLIGEGAKKSAGSLKLEPIQIIPVKIEYGARITDEFLYATEEKQLDILKAFNEGYSRKVARALDIMAMHGVNPRTKEKSDIIGKKSFDTADGIGTVNFDETAVEGNVESAIALVDEAYDVNGMAMAKTFSSTLASLTVNGVRQYPELAWGANPGQVRGLNVDVNSTVSFNDSEDMAIVGDFQNAFKWGYSKEIPLEVIKYGDPDQSGKDLKAYNQVYLRCETYLGWAIMDPKAFARITKKKS
jgi:HK97 family phage major capsid protein